LALAARWPIEIINVDSATIYQGMDIGTAKPTAAERARVPQHLLDIRDPAQSYSAAEFCRDTNTLIDQIRARNHVPVLAGGTMLYYKALREGLDDLPRADPVLRQQLAAQAANLGWPTMHARLAQLDAVTAARLAPNDSQRIQRALEICLLSCGPMSALMSRNRSLAHASPKNASSADTAINPLGTWTMVSLEPSNRLALHARITQRFDAMLASGLIDEVARLRARPDLHPALPAMRCVGYRQYWAHLGGEASAEQAREQAIAATRQLAKRQLTWLRADPKRLSIDCLAPDLVAQVIARCAPLLDRAVPARAAP
jgi:tRNA dimethylallyltransferase